MSEKYHLIGIGGIGMGALASILLSKGHQVSGSDVKKNSLIEQLKKDGAKVFIGHDAAHINDATCVIYSSAINEENVEVKSALEKNIPLKKRAQVLAELVNAEIGITIAGAHGKTTTTSMIANMLTMSGLNPTTAVGGIVNATSSNARLGSGKYFVAEADESDGTFLFFKPLYSVITNIDFEHLDYYHQWENIVEAYRQFIRQTKKEGIIFACGDDERLMKILNEEKIPFVKYGLGESNEIRAKNVKLDGYSTSFECWVKGKKIGNINLKIPGEHNAVNSLACVGIGLQLDLSSEQIVESLNQFCGVQRRFQKKAEINDILVIEDYGHHPTEIISTLNAARGFKKKRIVTVFQPHRYSRTKFLMDDFVKSLALSDYLVLTDIYAASEKPMDGVSSEILYEQLKKIHPNSVDYLKKDKISKHLIKIVKPGDMIIFLGAGDINQIGNEFVKELQLQNENSLNQLSML